MRTYKLTIAYDGSRYQGWQRQPSTDLTIQGTLEKTISGILGYDVEVQGSGRTDGGVHAKGQTASIVLRGKIEEAQFLSECAKRLPEDICIWKIELVKNGFHARHSARGYPGKGGCIFQKIYGTLSGGTGCFGDGKSCGHSGRGA